MALGMHMQIRLLYHLAAYDAQREFTLHVTHELVLRQIRRSEVFLWAEGAFVFLLGVCVPHEMHGKVLPADILPAMLTLPQALVSILLQACLEAPSAAFTRHHGWPEFMNMPPMSIQGIPTGIPIPTNLTGILLLLFPFCRFTPTPTYWDFFIFLFSLILILTFSSHILQFLLDVNKLRLFRRSFQFLLRVQALQPKLIGYKHLILTLSTYLHRVLREVLKRPAHTFRINIQVGNSLKSTINNRPKMLLRPQTDSTDRTGICIHDRFLIHRTFREGFGGIS